MVKNHQIPILNPDLTFSTFFGSLGTEDGQLHRPKDVAFESDGNVYVADNEKH